MSGLGARIQIDNREGLTAFVNGFHLARTYGGWLSGLPTERANQLLVEGHEHDAGRQFGDRPVQLVPPVIAPKSITLSDEPIVFPALPPWKAMAWLDLLWSPPSDDDHDGYHVVIAWFCDLPDAPLAEWLERQLREVDWRLKARGYRY